MSNKTMNCGQVKRLLPPLLDEELSGGVRDGVTNHLASCPTCRTELQELQADLGILEQVKAPEVTPFLATRVMAEIRQRQTVVARRGFRPGLVLAAMGAAMLVAVSLGVGTLVGSGLAQGRAGASGDDIFTTATVDPSLETYQSLTGGE